MCGRFEPIGSDELEGAIGRIRSKRVPHTSSGRDDLAHAGGCVELAALLDARGEDARDQDEAGTAPSALEALPATHARQATDARPGSTVCMLIVEGGHLELACKIWGYEAPWNPSQLIFNARLENALARPSGMWAESLALRRCVVPTRGFYETSRASRAQAARGAQPAVRPKRQARFEVGQHATFFLAGIWQADRFTVMTTAPNAVVSLVHDRMPVALLPREASIWLGTGYAALADRSGMPLREVNDDRK